MQDKILTGPVQGFEGWVCELRPENIYLQKKSLAAFAANQRRQVHFNQTSQIRQFNFKRLFFRGRILTLLRGRDAALRRPWREAPFHKTDIAARCPYLEETVAVPRGTLF